MHPHGKQYWRSLGELADPEQLREAVLREFPDGAAEWADPVTRRRFLQLMGASLALAGFTGCVRRPDEHIVPYVRKPEELVSGKVLYYATAMTHAGRGAGLLVESNEGRPTKIEGNPKHPASLGATDAFAQASVLSLYDPDRSQAVQYRGRPRPYAELVTILRDEFARRKRNKGAGLAVLTEIVSSPAMASQLRRFKEEYPEAGWYQYEPAAPDAALAGAEAALAAPADLKYKVEDADLILALDADFLASGPGWLANARAFASRRRVGKGARAMNRLYVVEPTPTTTGMKADERLPLRAGQIELLARALANELGVAKLAVESLPPPAGEWLKALAAELKKNEGKSVVLVGDGQPAAVHAIGHAINFHLKNVGKTVFCLDAIDAEPGNRLQSLTQLARDMEAKKVESVVILGGNPAYNAPADLEFAEKLRMVLLSVHLSLYEDETSQNCQWHVNESHYLESWGDVRAFDGTASIVQPLIAPLYQGKSALEFFAACVNPSQPSGYEMVRDYWRAHWAKLSGAGDFEHWWRKALHAGLVENTAFAPKPPRLQSDWAERAGLQKVPDGLVGEFSADDLEIVFRPDPTIHDGRFANNGWLQELPKPVTKLTWDNAVIISPATAKALKIDYPTLGNRGGEHGESITHLVELTLRGRTIRGPVWVMPGQADSSVMVHLGYGRSRAGNVGTNAGFNAYALQSSEAPLFDRSLRLRKTGERFTLACVQAHHPVGGKESLTAMDRKIIRDTTLSDWRGAQEKDENHRETENKRITLYDEGEKEFSYDAGNQWAMVIDMGACVGCGACVVACQAENNIPVVGKTEVTHGREMHWLRIDRYFSGPDPEENPIGHFQPVPCMQCENAPCELVCPVEATTHSSDGLNEMTYNRCVGTRYCSNNCPYKVRRFNFLQYADYAKNSLNLLQNPQVTVRTRGVMEKCTYCIQRIREAEINAKNQRRPLHDGEVITACQSACPAQAIVFGNKNDPRSALMRRVTQAQEAGLHYSMLEDLNTRPRTTYIAAVRNPKEVDG